MKKTFDCMAMKRKAQERIYQETRGLSRDEELAYFHRAAAEFQMEIKRLRENIVKEQRMPSV